MGPGPQRGPHAAQRVGVVPQVRAHRGRQGQVLGRGPRVPGPGQRQAQAELGVVVARAGLHDAAEVAGRGRVPPGVELGPGQRLEDAAGVRLGGGRPLEQLRRRGRAAPPEQVQPAPVQVVGVVAGVGRPAVFRCLGCLSGGFLLSTGILAAGWSF